MEDEIKKVISSLEIVESEFGRKGFDKKMGGDASLYVALMNRVVSAVDELYDIRSTQESKMEKEIQKRVHTILKKETHREIPKRQLETIEKVEKEFDEDKPKVKVASKPIQKTIKTVRGKVK
jgi:hypothetical protein